MLSIKKIVCAFPISLLVYALACLGIVILEYMLASIYKARTFEEQGPVENLQLILLLMASALFFAKSIHEKRFARSCLCFTGMCLFAIGRELDSFLDKNIGFIGWKIAFVMLIAPGVYCILDWRRTLMEFMVIARKRSFTLMYCAVIVLLPIAQCIGHKPFIINVLETSHVGLIKELIEESIETIGYFLVLCSSVELSMMQKYTKKKHS